MDTIKLKIEKEIKFQVSIEKGKARDVYGAGDYTAPTLYKVRRCLMLCDIPEAQGGTAPGKYFLGESILKKYEQNGVCEFGSFRSESLAQIFCDALNAKKQHELLELINNDKYIKEVKL